MSGIRSLINARQHERPRGKILVAQLLAADLARHCTLTLQPMTCDQCLDIGAQLAGADQQDLGPAFEYRDFGFDEAQA